MFIFFIKFICQKRFNIYYYYCFREYGKFVNLKFTKLLIIIVSFLILDDIQFNIVLSNIVCIIQYLKVVSK